MKDQEMEMNWRKAIKRLVDEADIPEDRLETVYWLLERALVSSKPSEK